MNAEQFKTWADSLGLRTAHAIAKALGIGRNTVIKYRHEGTDNKCVRLAMAAVSAGLEPA